MKITLTALISMILIIGMSSAPAEARNTKVLIIGDSITERYNDTPGSALQGWWSMVARNKGWTPVTSARGSSGFQVRGHTCANGSTFTNRRFDIKKHRPDVIIVEGGRNDRYTCDSQNLRRYNTYKRAKAGVDYYFRVLNTYARAYGVAKRDVYVVTPWGYKDLAFRAKVQGYVYAAAKRHGFTYISTPRYTRPYFPDLIHPNLKGNKHLANLVTRAIR